MKIARTLLTYSLFVLSLHTSAQSQQFKMPRERPSQSLLTEYATSNNLRGFALQAITRPGEGGVFYAKHAANICGRDYAAVTRAGAAALDRQIRSAGTVPGYQLAMMEDLPRRCAGFVPGETSAFLADLKRFPLAEDPLLAAEEDVRDAARSGRPEAIRAAVLRAMVLDDPLLWTENRLYDAVAQSDPEARKVFGFYLNGVVYSEKDGLQHLEASTALDLGFCKPDLPCGLDDELRIVCATGGECAPDREAKARAFLLANGGAPEGWQRVIALAEQVRSAIANRNVGFFVR